MKPNNCALGAFAVYFILTVCVHVAHSEDKFVSNRTRVHIVADQAVNDDGECAGAPAGKCIYVVSIQ
jgi:hypothetical protein